MDDLAVAQLQAGLSGTRFADVEVYPSLASTQMLLVAEGGPDGRVVVADHQTAGRGRAGRTWLAEPGQGLLFSVLLRGIAPKSAPLVSLRAGLAVARAVERVAGVAGELKWPNDVLVDGAKVCGVLGDLAPDGSFVVVGVGVNVRGAPTGTDLPATSLIEASGRDVDRGDLLVAILRELEAVLADDAWLADYRARCSTLGRDVRVETTEGTITGTASDVRPDGALVVGATVVVSGDVVHVRPA